MSIYVHVHTQVRINTNMCKRCKNECVYMGVRTSTLHAYMQLSMHVKITWVKMSWLSSTVIIPQPRSNAIVNAMQTCLRFRKGQCITLHGAFETQRRL